MDIIYNVVEINKGKLIGVASFSTYKCAKEAFDKIRNRYGASERFENYVNDGNVEIALTHNDLDWGL